MITYTCTNKDAGKKVIKIIQDNFGEYSFLHIKKAFRKKDIKINKRWAKEDHIVDVGDTLVIYIKEEKDSKFKVLYEDENILIVNKKAGLSSHDNEKDGNMNLLNLLNKEYKEDIFLCHRLDRNTEGLLIAAKGKENSDSLRNMIKNNLIDKYYKCIVSGKLNKSEGILCDYLIKDSKNSIVKISKNHIEGSLQIKTGYKVIGEYKGYSALEIKLYTGRTHQIRAHLAYINHPIIGDCKYGDNLINKKYNKKYQLLCSYRIKFGDIKDKHFSYLSLKEFEIEPSFKSLLLP